MKFCLQEHINGTFSFSVTQQPKSGLGRLYITHRLSLSLFSHTHTRTHTHTHTHYDSSKLVISSLPTQHTTLNSMRSAGFKPAIPTIKRLQTHGTYLFTLDNLIHSCVVPHNDVSVNGGPHTRRWSHNIIILYYYNIVILTIVLQLPTVFNTVTCCTGL
jgi:hypothetical protein